MKKLLIATDNFLPRWDGIARYLLDIIPHLKDEYDVTVVAPDFTGSSMTVDVHVERIPLYSFDVGDYPPARLMPKKIRAYIEDADIVWVQTIGPIGALAMYYGKKLGKPVIATIHSIEWELVENCISDKYMIFKKPINFLTKTIARYFYNKCTLLMVPSRGVAMLHKYNRITVPKVVVHLGTDTERFKPATFRSEAKQKLGINMHKKVIGFCGRIGREKDLVTLFRAFNMIKKKRGDVLLLIVGKGVKELEQMFADKRDIMAVGAKDDVVPYLQAMDIYVLPSLTETSSLSTMEAMASGCAIITTKVGYVKDYIKEKKNGMFFPFRNSYVLRLKIEQLLDDKHLLVKLGVNARKTIQEQFAWKKTVDNIKHVLSRF